MFGGAIGAVILLYVLFLITRDFCSSTPSYCAVGGVVFAIVLAAVLYAIASKVLKL